ncbi:hypothetical protein [Pedococcus sp. 2YAF34]|uniref:hypothetical protein n=1 Tax=Pedococcus sp. 2YAF34 TaxID=3233032 RepID=UPI003F9AF5D2
MATVDHVVALAGRRSMLTVRTTYRLPVLMETSLVTVDPTGTALDLVSHPATDVLSPVTPVTVRALLVADDAATVAGT